MKKHIITLITGLIICTLNPIFAMNGEEPLLFPQPSGSFSIGYQNFELTDDHRDDPYNPGQNRKLKATVWYPSHDSPKAELYGTEEMEMTEEDKSRIASGLPEDAQEEIRERISQYALLKIHRSKNAKPAPGKFPLIIFSHGYMAKATSYQRLSHELVSHGYIMIAIHHPYLADRVDFENGVVFRIEDNPNELALRTYTGDVEFVLASLPKLIEALGLQATSKLDSIGVMGHSIGGEAIMRIVHNPVTNIKAAVCLDSTHSLKGLKRQNRETSGGCEGFDCPFMHILAGSHPLNGLTAQSLERAATEFNSIGLKKNNYKALMKHATHVCFEDSPLLARMFPSLAVERDLVLQTIISKKIIIIRHCFYVSFSIDF